jgi:hypothetical protein
MTLSLKGIARKSGEAASETTLLADGDSVIALVHDPHYALLFAHVEEMHELLTAVGTGPCDVDFRGMHSKLCKTCAARSLLAKLLPLSHAIRTN